MNRIKVLRNYVGNELLNLENKDKIMSAANHLYGVSLAATFIAEKRNLNSELAAMAGMLHDMHAYKSGSYTDHAHLGADLARNILNELQITNEEETDIICSMIYHHDDKLVIDSEMDEVLKDADVLDHSFTDLNKEVKEKEKVRYAALRKEFDLD